MIFSCHQKQKCSPLATFIKNLLIEFIRLISCNINNTDETRNLFFSGSYWTLKMKTVRSFKRSGSDYALTQCHIAEKRNPRQRTTFVNNVVEILGNCPT